MQAADLPAIPTVAKKVVKALGNPNTNLNDLNKKSSPLIRHSLRGF